jgi:phosphoribosylformylglycinamidine synthase
MAKPRVLVMRAPGTNCDRETAFAFDLAGGSAERVHINRLLEQPDIVQQYEILCVPGGFSYGDDVAAGRILASQIRRHLWQTMADFKQAGKLILGICNGFQVLIKSGILLDEGQDQSAPATLTWNDSGRYEDRWVHLSADDSSCVFLRGIEQLYLPVAHAEGKFVPGSEEHLAQLAAAGQLPLRYKNPNGTGNGDVHFPANPNGSVDNVAGVCDSTGRVLGLMPHPERHIDPTHHPRWTREGLKPEGDGLAIFRNAIDFFA